MSSTFAAPASADKTPVVPAPGRRLAGGLKMPKTLRALDLLLAQRSEDRLLDFLTSDSGCVV
jgi:hypothetical protein